MNLHGSGCRTQHRFSHGAQDLGSGLRGRWNMAAFLDGKVAVVTGAGRGIGKAIVDALCEHGASVAAVARTRADLELLAREHPGHVLPVTCDLTDEEAVRMCFDDNRIITMRQRRVMAIDDIHKAIEAGKGPASSSDFLVTITERIADRMGDVVSEIDDRVDEVEDSVITAESHELRTVLAGLRRQCISLRRYIAPQRDVLTRLQSERIAWLNDISKLHLREIAERTARFVEDIDTARDRAAITQEELNNRLSEQMNKAMYVLSITAAIFLPLGLLTGLLGINVGGIPGVESNLAFYNVSMFLLLLALVLVWNFKRIKWL